MKAPIETVENLDNPSAVGRINENFQVLSDAVQRSLSREDEGAEPNQMDTTLDMNNQRIINLPPPVHPTEPARHGQLQQYVDEVTELRDETIELRDETQILRNETEVFHDDTQERYESFFARYLGVHATDPEVDTFSNPLTEGAIYFNSVNRTWRVYNIRTVYVDDDPVYVNDDLVEVHQWEELPRGTLNALGDVNSGGLQHGDILIWNNGTQTWEVLPLSAQNTAYDPAASGLDALNVQDALDEIIERSMLNQYDIKMYLEGIPADGETVIRLISTRDFFLPSGLVGSIVNSAEPAAANHVWSIRKNGNLVGTINWTAASTDTTFTFAGDALFETGDILSVTVPTPADTTLRDVAIAFVAWRP